MLPVAAFQIWMWSISAVTGCAGDPTLSGSSSMVTQSSLTVWPGGSEIVLVTKPLWSCVAPVVRVAKAVPQAAELGPLLRLDAHHRAVVDREPHLQLRVEVGADAGRRSGRAPFAGDAVGPDPEERGLVVTAAPGESSQNPYSLLPTLEQPTTDQT